MTTPHKHAELLRIAANDRNARFMLKGTKNTYNLKGHSIFGVLQHSNKEWVVKPRVTQQTTDSQYLVSVCGSPYKVAKNLHVANMIIGQLRRKNKVGIATPFMSL